MALAVCALAGFGALHAAMVATRMEGQSSHAAADLDQFERERAARRGGWAEDGRGELLWMETVSEPDEGMKWNTVSVLQTNGARIVRWSSPEALPPPRRSR